MIDLYDIPSDIINPFINHFNPMVGRDRSEILLNYLDIEEIIMCYPKNYLADGLVNNLTKDLYPGIDEKKLYSIIKTSPDISAFGLLKGFHKLPSTLNLSLRIEKKGTEFKFPHPGLYWKIPESV